MTSFEVVSIESDKSLAKISDIRNLALNPRDIPVIREYFLDSKVMESRKEVGLFEPTDLELEYISQARSDHCNHNTFQGIFRYKDAANNEQVIENNLFIDCPVAIQIKPPEKLNPGLRDFFYRYHQLLGLLAGSVISYLQLIGPVKQPFC